MRTTATWIPEPAIAQAVAITGIGLVTPLGTGLGALDEALRSGRGAVRPCADLGRRLADRPGQGVMAAPIQDFSAAGAIEPARLRRVPRVGQLCIVAGREALGLSPGAAPVAAEVAARYGPGRVGIVLGTALGAVDQMMEFQAGALLGGPEGASPALFPTTVMNTAAALMAMELQLTGPNITVNHRDLSAAEAVATARDQLLLGRADAVLAGGFEELGPWLVHGYDRFGALCPPGEPMCPYDRRRSGVALGEGAAVLLLERLADAEARGAAIHGVLLSAGRGGDEGPRIGWHAPAPGTAPPGACAAVAAALSQAGTDPDYVAGGGNGTPLEALETAVLRAALGAAAERVPISSVLGQTGESMMSPALRLCTALWALRAQTVPGTAGCEEPDPDASLPGLRLRPEATPLRTALVPVLAQGGGAVALLICRGPR